MLFLIIPGVPASEAGDVSSDVASLQAEIEQQKNEILNQTNTIEKMVRISVLDYLFLSSTEKHL